MRSLDEGPFELRSDEEGPFEMRFNEIGPFEMRSLEAGPFEMRFSKAGLFEMRFMEVDPFEMRSNEVGPSQVASSEVKPPAITFLSVTIFVITANNHTEHGGNVSGWFRLLRRFRLLVVVQADQCFGRNRVWFLPAPVLAKKGGEGFHY